MNTLKKVFSAVLGVEESSITSDLTPENTPSWDSLNAIVLVSEVEKVFGVKFTYDEVMEVKNFGDIVRIVESKGIKLNA